MRFITIHNGYLSATINEFGAEIISLQDEMGKERIWQGDGIHWPKHAPILFPVAGGLKGGEYRLGGRAYALSRHGFARERMFEVEAKTAESVTFALKGDAARDANYPFEYVFRARYTLDGLSLIAETTVENTGGAPMYYSAGAHEAYACPEGIGAYDLIFEKAEPIRRARFTGGLLSGDTVLVPSSGGVLPVTPDLFVEDTLVLNEMASRSVTLRCRESGETVRVDYRDFPFLLVWTQPGANFLCIEPWHNLPDYAAFTGELPDKPGVIRVEPGESSVLTHTMTFA